MLHLIKQASTLTDNYFADKRFIYFEKKLFNTNVYIIFQKIDPGCTDCFVLVVLMEKIQTIQKTILIIC